MKKREERAHALDTLRSILFVKSIMSNHYHGKEEEEENVIRLGLDYFLISVPGDGNCLYHVFCRALSSSSSSSPQELRHKCCSCFYDILFSEVEDENVIIEKWSKSAKEEWENINDEQVLIFSQKCRKGSDSHPLLHVLMKEFIALFNKKINSNVKKYLEQLKRDEKNYKGRYKN